MSIEENELKGFSPWQWKQVDAIPTPREVLIDYLFVKAHQGDWHAVRDAAVDLELLELRLELEPEGHPFIRAETGLWMPRRRTWPSTRG